MGPPVPCPDRCLILMFPRGRGLNTPIWVFTVSVIVVETGTLVFEVVHAGVRCSPGRWWGVRGSRYIVGHREDTFVPLRTSLQVTPISEGVPRPELSEDVVDRLSSEAELRTKVPATHLTSQGECAGVRVRVEGRYSHSSDASRRRERVTVDRVNRGRRQ